MKHFFTITIESRNRACPIKRPRAHNRARSENKTTMNFTSLNFERKANFDSFDSFRAEHIVCQKLHV
jgi:hypothetical protein